MSMLVGYPDFIRLLQVKDPENWVPSLEVRQEGVFVRPPPSHVDLAPEERAVLSEHPTGNLCEPALRFPASIEELEQFVEAYGLHGYVNAFDLLKWLKKSAFVAAQLAEQEKAVYYWPIVAGITRVRTSLEDEIQRAQREGKDSRLVALRWVSDQLDRAFDDMTPAEVGPAFNEDSKVIAALVDLILAENPSLYSSQADVVTALLARFNGVRGISKRNIDGKLASGNGSLGIKRRA
jgi:hypothetical protein